MAESNKSVHEAILAIMSELGTFQKSLEVDDITSPRVYNVISFDDIVSRVQPLLVQHGLLISPHKVLEAKSWDADPGSGMTHFAMVTIQWKAVGPDRSEEFFESVGESESKNCKSIAAACSFAEKTLYRSLFHIVVGDPDPDAVGGTVVNVEHTTQGTRPAASPSPASAPRAAAPSPRPPAPVPQSAMKEKISAAAGTTPAANGEVKMASKPMRSLIWAVGKKTLQWDDPKLIAFISKVTGLDYSDFDGDLDEVLESLTFDQAKSIGTKIKSQAGQK